MTFLLLLTLVSPTTANAVANRNELRLSEIVTITVTIEGDTPLRVTPPASWQPSGDRTWTVMPDGPARIEEITPGRQRWTLRLTADPAMPGDLTVTLPPANVQVGQEASATATMFPPVAVRVTSSVNPGDMPRPPTDIEPTPPETDGGGSLGRWFWAAFWLVGIALFVAAVRWPRRRRGTSALDPRQRFLHDLDALKQTDDGEFAASLSATVRAYAEAADGLPAPRRTAREIAPLTTQTPRLGSLAELLGRCDEARFSGEPLTLDARAKLLADAARLA